VEHVCSSPEFWRACVLTVNSVQDGVLILFTYMKNVTYDPKTDSITLQPGIHWQEAVDALEPFGVAPVGGEFVWDQLGSCTDRM
jgi:hypothetical protein